MSLFRRAAAPPTPRAIPVALRAGRVGTEGHRYYIAVNVPGATLMTAMTPGQLQATMRGGGTLYPDSVTSSDGQTYSIQGLLKQAFAANQRAGQMQAVDPAMDNSYLDGAEALLDQMRADSSPASSQRSVLFGSASHGPDTAKDIRTLVLQMGGGGSDPVRLTIVYFSPGSGSLAAAPSAQPAPSRLRLTAQGRPDDWLNPDRRLTVR